MPNALKSRNCSRSLFIGKALFPNIGLHSPFLEGIEANMCTLSQLFFLLFKYYLIYSIVSKTTNSCSAKHIDQQLTYRGGF